MEIAPDPGPRGGEAIAQLPSEIPHYHRLSPIPGGILAAEPTYILRKKEVKKWPFAMPISSAR